MEKNTHKPEVLLHICCGPDATAVYERLSGLFRVTGYFHNPNIYPQEEYRRRSREALRAGDEMGFPVIVPAYQPNKWNEKIKGLENEPEKGRRCQVCFRFNLKATACKARNMGIPHFTTTLTISPYKDSRLIILIGEEVGEETGVYFLAQDFKKKNGFQRSLELSRQFDMYRQNYCGCRFSMRK